MVALFFTDIERRFRKKRREKRENKKIKKKRERIEKNTYFLVI